MTAIIYAIVGHWIWGGGWLSARGMLDFAGSTVVHSVGGWAALAGVLVIGPRLGRFDKNYDEKRFSAVPVHLDTGIWGTLAVGFFHLEKGLFYGKRWEFLKTQALGVLTVGIFTFLVSLIVFYLLKATVGVRVSAEIEKQGLDLKHGHAAYPDFSHNHS